MRNKTDLFNLLRKMTFEPNLSQRQLAKDLGFSLGKLNYCIKALNRKGLIKIKNFNKKEDRLNYFRRYVLTQQGIDHRINLTIDFMKRKIAEYDQLKKEMKK